MSAKYQFFKSPKSPLKPEQEETYYPRIVSSKTIPIDTLCDQIALMSTASAGTAGGVLRDFKKLLIREMLDGNRVVWKGLGTFYITLCSDPVADPDKVRAESIRISKFVFAPDKELKRAGKSFRPERAGNHPKSSPFTPEVRRERILAYVRRKYSIQTADCMQINQTSRYTSQLDLKALVKEKILIRVGRNRSTLYILPPKP